MPSASKDMSPTIQEEKVPWWTSCRLALSINLFFACVCVYGMRISMSVGIVCMTFDRNMEENNHTDSNNLTTSSAIDNIDDFSSGKGEFFWSRTEVGLVLAAFYIGYIFTQMPGGVMATKVGARNVVGAGVLLQALLTLLTPPAARLSVYVLMVLQIFKGVVCGGFFPAFYQQLGRWSPPQERAFLMSVSASGTLIGSVLSSILAGYLCDHGFAGGWPSIFYVLGIASVLWYIVWHFTGYSSPSEHPRISLSELKYIESSFPSQSEFKKLRVPWKQIVKTVPLYGILITDLCGTWSFYISLTYVPQYLNDILKIDIQSNGLYSALPSLVNPVFAISGGLLADFIVRRNLLKLTWNRKLMQTLGLVPCAAISIWIGYLTPNDKALAITLLSLFGGLTGFTMSGSATNVLDMAPRYSGILMGMDNTLATLPGILVPTVTSAMTKHGTLEEWQRVFFVAAGILLFGWIAYIILGDATEQKWAHQTDDTGTSDTKGIDNPTYTEEYVSQHI